MNSRIRAPRVRLVGESGEVMGIVTLAEARARAEAAGLDLVEVDPRGDPPTCKLLDFGRWKYEAKRKPEPGLHVSKRPSVKQIRLRPGTAEHDCEVKVATALALLEKGHRVKLTLRFRGREITHPELGRARLDEMLALLGDRIRLESPPSLDGRTLSVVVLPSPYFLLEAIRHRGGTLR